MAGKKFVVLTHGGAASKNEYADGTKKSAETGVRSLQTGGTILAAVCSAVKALEDDTRFNAGTGSRPRADGILQMDAACMDSESRFGAVAAVSGFKNPITIAHALSNGPHRVMAGTGAEAYARAQGCEVLDLKGRKIKKSRTRVTDTVGCVAFDGKSFAAALSTGGTSGSPPGRVGDVPLIGCGLYAGPKGAVAATGLGEAIAMNVTAFRVYQMLEQDALPESVLREALRWFSDDFGLILVSRKGYAGGSNRTMAWSVCEAKVS